MAKKKPINKNTKAYQKKQERLAYKKALKEWSLKVRTRDGFKCVLCGSSEKLNAHHILEKIYYKEYSLNPDIGITLCPRGHKWGKFAAHMNSLFFITWLQKNRPWQYEICVKLMEEDIAKNGCSCKHKKA